MALIDADLILFVVDITDKKIEEKTVERLKTTEIPVFVLINKIDLSTQEQVEQVVNYWREQLPNATVFPLSAQYGANVEFIFKQILEKLPECPPYFPKDELTDRSMRFFITEIIREKILLNYQQEIPYSVQVEVERHPHTKCHIRGPRLAESHHHRQGRQRHQETRNTGPHRHRGIYGKEDFPRTFRESRQGLARQRGRIETVWV